MTTKFPQHPEAELHRRVGSFVCAHSTELWALACAISSGARLVADLGCDAENAGEGDETYATAVNIDALVRLIGAASAHLATTLERVFDEENKWREARQDLPRATAPEADEPEASA